MQEPALKSAIAFVDGQNLFHHAKSAFGYSFPNYDVDKLARLICERENWNLKAVHFYTGIPDAQDKPEWHRFWTNKTATMGRKGVRVFTRPLKYRNKTFTLPDGTKSTILIGEEKGIDVRLAIDIIGKAIGGDYDVALVFSRDQDLSEVADEIRVISRQQDRWIKIVCAFPVSPTATNRRGINGTQWVKIDRALYDLCLDPVDHR